MKPFLFLFQAEDCPNPLASLLFSNANRAASSNSWLMPFLFFTTTLLQQPRKKKTDQLSYHHPIPPWIFNKQYLISTFFLFFVRECRSKENLCKKETQTIFKQIQPFFRTSDNLFEIKTQLYFTKNWILKHRYQR